MYNTGFLRLVSITNLCFDTILTWYHISSSLKLLYTTCSDTTLCGIISSHVLGYCIQYALIPPCMVSYLPVPRECTIYVIVRAYTSTKCHIVVFWRQNWEVINYGTRNVVIKQGLNCNSQKGYENHKMSRDGT